MRKKRMKDVLATAVVTALVVGAVPTAFAKVSKMDIPVSFNNIKIVVDGTQLTTDKEPFIYDGTTYLPVRAVAEAVGKDVAWDSTTQTVTLSGGSAVATEAPKEIVEPKETTPTTKEFTLGIGYYIVGEDISAGKYNCVATSGAGNFIGDVKDSGLLGVVNVILAVEGHQFGYASEYSNLRLQDGDTIEITGDLKVEFLAQ